MMSPDHDYKPRLRNVEPIPVLVQGKEAIGLKDPFQLIDGILCVPKEALPVLALLDGRHSLHDIQAELTRRTGQLVFSDQVRGIVDMLDKACLLYGERFQGALEKKLAEYRAMPYRPASHAGRSYSGDPAALGAELTAFFTGVEGPGIPEFFSDSRRPVGLIAPHIDVRSGGSCFAQAYHALGSGQPSDVYVIFGTGHAGVENVFTATNLDFQTPLGRVQADRDFLDALAREYGADPAPEELLHANEHVIEFQLIFLQYLFSGRHHFTVVPILSALSHHFFQDDHGFEEQRQIFDRFCSAVSAVCRQSSRSVCFIASADLDHIGPRYGDAFVPHKGTVAEALEKDRVLLASLERVDTGGFIQGVARDDDVRRICGFSPITAMLHCMNASEGHLLGLDYARVDDRNSFVSFCSMIFYE